MPDDRQDHETRPAAGMGLGIFARQELARISPAEIAAGAVALVWLLGVLIYFAIVPAEGEPAGGSGLTLVMTLVGILMPLALIWLAASAARSARLLRAEATDLQAALDVMRLQQGDSPRPATARTLPGTNSPRPRSDRPGPGSGPMGGQSARDAQAMPFSTVRTGAVPAADLPEEPLLDLDPPAGPEAPPLSIGDFISALNFPEDAEDADGFRALRAALAHRDSARLVRAAQDVLTLLSQDGVYMDDLSPDRAHPDVWRRFAAGQRGAAIAGLGGIRTPEYVEVVAMRMRQDTVFRDAAHHFLRQFDQTFGRFAPEATDAEVAAASDTRTARAFMLIGRAAGLFDEA